MVQLQFETFYQLTTFLASAASLGTLAAVSTVTRAAVTALADTRTAASCTSVSTLAVWATAAVSWREGRRFRSNIF